MENKKRLDVLLTDKGLFPSRTQAQAAIIARKVKVDGQRVDSPSKMVGWQSEIEVIEPPRYVSRGGLKLEGALDRFKLDVSGRSAIDIGASTGGFTDCLLKRDVSRVIAVDVGYGQFDWKLRNDPRVTLLERTNVKHLRHEDLPYFPDLATVDLSFISTAKVLPFLIPLLGKRFDVIVLVKPQFEGEREMVEKGGVVRSSENHKKILENFLDKARSLKLSAIDITYSEPKGKDGNIEYFFWLAEEERVSKIQGDFYTKIVETVESVFLL